MSSESFTNNASVSVFPYCLSLSINCLSLQLVLVVGAPLPFCRVSSTFEYRKRGWVFFLKLLINKTYDVTDELSNLWRSLVNQILNDRPKKSIPFHHRNYKKQYSDRIAFRSCPPFWLTGGGPAPEHRTTVPSSHMVGSLEQYLSEVRMQITPTASHHQTGGPGALYSVLMRGSGTMI